jgi:hypothetical protein
MASTPTGPVLRTERPRRGPSELPSLGAGKGLLSGELQGLPWGSVSSLLRAAILFAVAGKAHHGIFNYILSRGRGTRARKGKRDPCFVCVRSPCACSTWSETRLIRRSGTVRGRCHAASRLRSHWRPDSQADAENQLRGLPVPARDHSTGDLALLDVATLRCAQIPVVPQRLG